MNDESDIAVSFLENLVNDDIQGKNRVTIEADQFCVYSFYLRTHVK